MGLREEVAGWPLRATQWKSDSSCNIGPKSKQGSSSKGFTLIVKVTTNENVGTKLTKCVSTTFIIEHTSEKKTLFVMAYEKSSYHILKVPLVHVCFIWKVPGKRASHYLKLCYDIWNDCKNIRLTSQIKIDFCYSLKYKLKTFAWVTFLFRFLIKF